MLFFESCRYHAFWLFDRLKGGIVKKAYDIIEKCDKGIWSEEKIDAYQKDALNKLLEHSRKTVAAYKDQTTLELTYWPVIKKTDLKDRLDDHLSSDFNKEDLIVMSTSGSTGTPFRSYQDWNKKKHVYSEVIYYNGLVQYNVGKRLIYFRSIVKENKKNLFSQKMQNYIQFNTHDLSDEGIKTQLQNLKKRTSNNNALIISYASTLDAYRTFFEKNGYEEAKGCNICGVVSGSEILQDIIRNSIKKAFGCKVVSRYSNEENGFLGQDDMDNNVFVPNRADYYFEILKLSSDEPAAEGEVGRIVVTDLYNYAMPFVRYDTGDVGAWVYTTHFGKKVKAIGNFGGRVVDMIFDTNGNQVSPHTVTNTMWEFQGIKQYQFVQQGEKKYLLKLNMENGISCNEAKLLSIMHEKFGNDAEFEIQYCDEIPVLASGKRRYIVNEMLH